MTISAMVLLGGKTHELQMGLKAVLYVEKQFGDMDAFRERFRKPLGKGWVRAVLTGVTAGLLHEKPADMSLDAFEEYVIDALDHYIGGAGDLVGFARALGAAEVV